MDTEISDKEVPAEIGVMGFVLNQTKNPPAEGELVEGTVLGVERAVVYIDLSPLGTGIIYGREFNNARDLIKKMNKGGIILEWQGLQGFLPASQLKTEHYPRIDDGDKNKILDELRKLTGTKLSVSIIAAVPKENKLIFSEKTLEQEDKEKIIEKYTVGEITEGTVTGVVDFGIFVKLEEGLEGLVHISEMDWALVDNPRSRFKTGDMVKVKVIEIKGGKISLSIKALKPNPWVEAANKYHKDDVIKAVIIKFNKHGALGSIEEGVAGLVHISEFGSEEKLRTILELGKTYDFKITLFEPKEQRMTLSYVAK